ncbi:MAG: hypothetical protein IJ778_00010 [Alphaproteobacteria bacterium]|nr:hypothetical protein [Alphaproteobacteria bacterium]
MNKIDELREKILPDFKTKEEFYAYVADNNSVKITPEQAFKEIDDNLLPVFKVAKELCEHLSGDKDFFEQKEYAKHLYYMALVSRMVKNIDRLGGTDEEKKESLRLSDPHYGGMFYIKNGQKTKELSLFSEKEDKGFKDLISKAGIGCSTYEDSLTTIYFGAIQEDISPIFKEQQIASVSGNFLNWQVAKDSGVLWAATQPFIDNEMVKMAQENGVAYARRHNFYQDAEKKIHTKIVEFCDMKQAECQKNLIKWNKKSDCKQ